MSGPVVDGPTITLGLNIPREKGAVFVVENGGGVCISAVEFGVNQGHQGHQTAIFDRWDVVDTL